jgi:hypothetical protein
MKKFWTIAAGTVAFAAWVAGKHLLAMQSGSSAAATSPPERPPSPEASFVGDPGEVITLTTTIQVTNLDPIFRTPRSIGSGPRLYSSFMAQNSKGAVEYSEAYNADTASEQDRLVVLNKFIRQLERAGWEHVSGLTLRWRGR